MNLKTIKWETRIAPPLVRRCNGTTAGLGYWKVGLEWPYNTPPGQWICDSNIKLEDVDGLNVNCLGLADYHSDTALLEPLISGAQVQVPVGEKGLKLSTTDCKLKRTQEWEFFGFDFEFCTISMLVMYK